ncbi:diguanylate cyclase [Marinobacter sp. F3R08]|uniref:sensor domain-containing diguanylate cyclase n=1 Tax=Marinobacter sp. F3R08 TaxID=2841559 RepID=UPI001C09CF77|nr:diguanylate cyclase [Marinobacter sp. F3R08]MBU2955454.1 sensor domain-containing diguanylate cyclase [Marinobacter sp. F3R08]
MSSFLRLIALVSLVLAPALAQPDARPIPTACPTLEATDSTARAALMQYICYYSASPGAPGHQATGPEQLPEDLQWVPANGWDLVFSHTKSVYWIHLNVKNSGPERGVWYLKLSYPLLDEVTIWQAGNDTTEMVVTGDQHPFETRPVDYRYFLLPVTLDGGETQSLTIRIHSSGALNVPLSFETAAEAIARSNHLTLTHGLLYGALLVFAAFNLLLFLSSGTGDYFYNAFYLAALGLFLFAMGGFANQYFWPDNASFANTSIPLSLSLCALAMILFGRSFLDVNRGTISETVLKAEAWSSIGLLALTLVLPYSKTILLNTVLTLTVISSLFVIAAVRWKQGYQPAVWYLLAWLVMLLAGLVYALAAFGHITDFLAREALMQSAVGGQIILLNYALVQRWRLLSQKLLDVEHDARAELEIKVHRRTAQLRDTMRELENANRQLSMMSLNDALTGLHNRRHLNTIFPELSAEARRNAQPLTLALVDADHFKTINDTWGHGFGDTCLQFLAEMLTRHVKRPRDVAIRFGGEEFALVLPGTDSAGALNVCTALLEDIASTTLLAPDGTEVTITLSGGIASLNPGETQSQLFDRADKALYRAKSEGRNRVLLAETAGIENTSGNQHLIHKDSGLAGSR